MTKSGKDQHTPQALQAVISERLALVKGIPLSVGGHACPDGVPEEFCLLEKHSYIRGLPWSDRGNDISPVIAAFGRAFQDATDQDGRDKIDAWWLANIDRIIATKDDGHDEARGYMAADWAVRVSLPLWLELAEAPDAASALRALKPIVDEATARTARSAAYEARDGLPNLNAWRAEIREKARVAFLKVWEEKKAGAAVAAVALKSLEPFGVAWWKIRDAAYNAARDAFRGKFAEKWAPATVPIKASALDLIERMVALGETDPAEAT